MQLHCVVMNFSIQILLKSGEVQKDVQKMNAGDDHCASQEHKSFWPEEQSNSLLLILHLEL